ncbi:MAG TPA: N-acetylmuramoyl-L-alanine amidase [Mycobacteriales bacterium]|nr:N-acetylmuramoyl-L-alanine amidase [Mycobacteriales bacterium]
MLVLLLVAPALPISAQPLPPVVEAAVRTLPIGLGETVQRLADGEQLVGVTWTEGQPQVEVRWRTPSGWTAWEAAEPDDALDPADRERTRPGTEPVWRPRGADVVAVRVAGQARGLELVRVGDGQVRDGGLTFGLPRADAAVRRHHLGVVHTRAEWGADERMRRSAPSYASSVRAVVVHHTAGGNDYRPEEVPARLRADYAYHVRSRGWSDLGYNLVVDRFGRVWEGRAGGIDRAVIGTHAAGFNTGTLGVSVMGDYTRTTATRGVVDALSRVSAFAAWRWRFDPRGSVRMTSGGSPRYRAGTVVTLPRVHGHRDTGRTACPGSLQDRLPDVRQRAAVRLWGPPVLQALSVTGSPVHAPQPLVVDARLSRPVAWEVRVEESGGQIVVRRGGRSARPQLSWNGMRPLGPVPVPALPGEYRWVVLWDDGVHGLQRRAGRLTVSTPVVRVP